MTFENAPEERAQNAQALAEQIDAEVYEGGKNLWDNLVAICEQVPEGEGVIIAEDDVKISSKFNPVEGDEIINYFYNVKGSFNTLYKKFMIQDKKKIYNLFAEDPHNLTAKEKERFDKENPYWEKFFEERQ